MSIAKVYFRLRSNKGTKPQPIYLVYRFGQNDKLLYPVGLTCKPQQWNNKTSRPRDITENAAKDTIINKLDELQAKADKYILAEKAAGRNVTKYGLRNCLEKVAPTRQVLRKSDLFDFIEDYLQNIQNKINPATGRPISEKTAKGYKAAVKMLFEYADKNKITLSFSDIDKNFYYSFLSFLQAPPYEYANNTIGLCIRHIKAILNAATDCGANTCLLYKSRAFKALKEESENIYLTNSELSALAALDLSKFPYLDRVRDLFLIGANTGLRFSDFKQLTPENLHPVANGYNIILMQQKTGGRVIIPANSTFLQIWNKYGGNLPKGPIEPQFNKAIKIITSKISFLISPAPDWLNAPAKQQIYLPAIFKPNYKILQKVRAIASYSTITTKHITKGGQKLTITGTKGEFVTAHTARRSFATNLYLSGFPAIAIMKITGHKTETAFLKYIKVTEEQHADLLRKHWEKIAAENEQ